MYPGYKNFFPPRLQGRVSSTPFPFFNCVGSLACVASSKRVGSTFFFFFLFSFLSEGFDRNLDNLSTSASTVFLLSRLPVRKESGDGGSIAHFRSIL